MSDLSRPHRPVVLGYDAVSPLGVDFDAEWERAVAGASGVGPLTRFPLTERFPVRLAGQVPACDFSPYPFLSPRKLAAWSSPVFAHAILVAHRALARAGIVVDDQLSPRVAVTFGTAVGGLDAVLAADRALMTAGTLPMPWMNPNSCVNMPTGAVAMSLNATGPIVTPVTACATGATSIALGALMLENDMADVAICGAVDFSLVEPIVAGFASMNGAYKSRPGERAAEVSRPFSAGRAGFIVAEGAACIVLSTPAFARTHGLTPKCVLLGWAMNADAHKPVAPRRDTIGRCMQLALERAGCRPEEVDAISAHAASTSTGDRVEADALGDVFGAAVPPLSALKSQTGHMMGASSAIETVFAIEGLRRSLLTPTLNYVPDPEFRVDAATETRRLDQRVVLKNSFGFGGANTCLILHQPEN
ncbi:MAG: beta-ketoacyl-[acyl-carrier-protein] synthase family protein [Polyangiaceae bacterium]|nr:beta-ketoacyl-[acyl-carrier-protein] synthase family protein [Polyangiaceae bacterium]